MKLNKTEQEIMAEIEKKGYTSIEHGHGFNYKQKYGDRRVNARNSLISKGLIEVTQHGKETDAHRGRMSVHFWSVVRKVVK